MAMCPHCFEQKQFFAPRCPQCNSEVWMWQQIAIYILLWITRIIIYGGALLLVIWFFS
jgi:hypothetical protein